MKVQRTILSALGMIAALAVSATATTINFNALPTGELPAGGTYTEGLFTITAGTSSTGQVSVVDLGGSHQNVVEDNNSGDTTGAFFTITRTDGGWFTVNSIAVANFGGGDPTTVTCTGGTGGDVSQPQP